MGLFWGPTYKSKSPDEKIVFRIEYDVDMFLQDWGLRQSLATDEERDFLKNLLMKYLRDSDQGLQVKEIRFQILPELQEHSYNNPFSHSDFLKLRDMLLEL